MKPYPDHIKFVLDLGDGVVVNWDSKRNVGAYIFVSDYSYSYNSPQVFLSWEELFTDMDDVFMLQDNECGYDIHDLIARYYDTRVALDVSPADVTISKKRLINYIKSTTKA